MIYQGGARDTEEVAARSSHYVKAVYPVPAVMFPTYSPAFKSSHVLGMRRNPRGFASAGVLEQHAIHYVLFGRLGPSLPVQVSDLTRTHRILGGQ